LNDGEYSCAFFVSSLLALAGYLPKPNTTVVGLRARLKESSFTEIPADSIEPGDVIFWEKIVFPDGSANEHVGFALDNTRAVSTSYKKKEVVEHPMNLPGNLSTEPRKITLVLRAPRNSLAVHGHREVKEGIVRSVFNLKVVYLDPLEYSRTLSPTIPCTLSPR
jgi:hypothetical protein